MNIEILSDNPFVQALAISLSMAVFMIGVALGIINIVKTGTPPVPFALLLLIFAIVFIAGSVFFEERGADHVGSLIGGCIAAFTATFALMSFFSGIVYALNGGITTLGWENIISALAICMVASMVMIRILSHKLQNQFA
ncbi:MAG TPA: heat-shock protein [Methanosarcinaceae archaeon]|nr:heat-shock protein [Methanosarcinaceae archaeon]